MKKSLLSVSLEDVSCPGGEQLLSLSVELLPCHGPDHVHFVSQSRPTFKLLPRVFSHIREMKLAQHEQGTRTQHVTPNSRASVVV